MRINNECVRKILIEIEKMPYGNVITVQELQEKIPEYNIDEVIATVTMLNRERYITVFDKAGYDDADVFRDNRIKCLTERGYRNLDLVRNDKIWNLMKERITDFNELSFFTIASIANKILNSEHNKALDLNDELFVDYTKW